MRPGPASSAWLVAAAAFLVLLAEPVAAANRTTDGDMQVAGIGNWPHADVTLTNSSAKATDRAASGQSLKGTSATGKGVNVSWYNANTPNLGSITGGTDVVLLSLWWGAQYNTSASAATGTLYFDVRPVAGTWTTAWSLALTPSTTFQSGTVTNLDISSFFATTASYECRVRFAGKTGNANGATINIWWDNVFVDVTTPATTTVGNGTNPSNASPCPGGAATMLDAFTLQTSAGTDTVTAVQVTFAAGTATRLSLVEITNDAGSTVHGSQSNPTDVQNVTLTTSITATTTLTPYKIRITPKDHASMPAPPGAAYAVTGTVTAITSTNAKSYNDSSSATVTVDNASPANATWGTVTAGDSQVSLAWTNPGDADFGAVLILRNTATITDAPTEGDSSYTAGGTIGSSTIVYVGAGTSTTDTGVVNGTDYYYEIFARDTCVNYATGAQTGPHHPRGTTTVANGTNPGNASLCPGGAATMLDAFTLQTSNDSDTVTAVQVTFAAGTAASLSLVEITNDAGGTVHGSQSNPSDTQTVTLTTNITATTSATQYKVRVTPKSHANMPAPPGSSQAVTGTVTSLTSDNTKSYNDSSSATVTVDNLSPANPAWGTITPGSGQVGLSWTNPADADFAQVLILRNTVAPINDAPTEGQTYVVPGTIGSSTIVYVGSGTSFTDTGLTNGTDYWYEIFARDTCVNWSTGNQTGPHRPAGNTLTVGNGTDPASATPCPGAAAAMLDAFTLQTGTGTDTVTAVQVTFAAGTATRLSLVEITNDAGGTVHGSQSNPADVQTVTLTTSITATTTQVQYKVRVTPKGHAAMPAPPGGSYAVTGTVTDVTSTLSKSYSDTASATLTIDNLSTGNPTWGTITPGDQQVALTWSNPADVDFAQVIILRRPGTISDAPEEGQTYTAGNIIGASTVVYAGTGLAHTDTDLTNGTDYWYKIFARDTCVNWSTGSQTGPHRPRATTTVGDGTDPASASRCPGGANAQLDAFTLHASSGTDVVTAMTVTFATGTAAGLSQVEITNDAGGTVYGSAGNPADVQAITLATSITATTTATPYRVRITPKSHAAMPAPPGVSYAVTGRITAITSLQLPSYQDTDSATITVDNGSPSNAAWGIITPGDQQVVLNWTNPSDVDFAQVIILRRTAAIADAPTEGQTYSAGNTIGSSTVVYAGSGVTYTDTGLTNGTSYWYKIFARDTCVNYATGSQSGPHVPETSNPVTVGTATATVDSCTQITVTAPFTRDANANSSTTVERATAEAGPWTAACSGLTGVSPRTCVDSGRTAGETYWYKVTFSDPDGVSGTNPQTIGPRVTPACPANGTTVQSNTAQASSCRQITATARFAGDDDEDGSTKFEYNTSDTWTGSQTTACAAVSGPSPRQCIIPGLTPGSSYWVRVTHTDPDGVTGTNPQSVGPTALATCGADDAAPMALILAPRRDAVLGGTDKVKVQVYDAGGLRASSPVEWSLDGGAYAAATVNANYSCGTSCSVYEFNLDTTSLLNGDHWITIRVTDAAATANVALVTHGFRSYNVGVRAGGGGGLLRRTPGGQVCIDCHDLPTHSSQSTSTQYGNWAIDCVVCHVPHRTRNVFLIGETVQTPNSGRKSIKFHVDDRTGETNPGGPGDTGNGRYSFLGDRSNPSAGGTNSPYDDGICEACHTRTTHWRNSTSGGDHDHNAATRCINCHPHDAGFKGAGGGDCLSCHGTQTQGPRRAVTADFSLQSHHVGNGSTMGGTLTNWDCVVCHAEGKVIDPNGTPNTGDESTMTTGLHMNDVMDLRNVDVADPAGADPTSTFAYDKDAVGASAGAAGNWNSANQIWREWTSGVNETGGATLPAGAGLDPFCLSCHDANGATASYAANSGGTALNPFGDGTVTNNYDQMNRTRVVNVSTQTVGSPPTDGMYSRHAIRGKSTSRYTSYGPLAGADMSIHEAGFFTVNTGEPFVGMTDESGAPVWNDKAVMGCADCHTTDGANASGGNAHGAASEYMLKDRNGTANEGNWLGAGNAGNDYNCYRCHDPGEYDGSAHTGNTSDWVDTTGLTGTARAGGGNTTQGNMFAMACTNCHGGFGFGSIHGTSQVIGVGQNGGAGTRNAYRFMNGASLRFYDPAGWTGSSATCYTLSSSTDDQWGDCWKHDRGTGHTRSLTRPIDY